MPMNWSELSPEFQRLLQRRAYDRRRISRTRLSDLTGAGGQGLLLLPREPYLGAGGGQPGHSGHQRSAALSE